MRLLFVGCVRGVRVEFDARRDLLRPFAGRQPSDAPLSNESKALTRHVPLSRGIAPSGAPLLGLKCESAGKNNPSIRRGSNGSSSLDNEFNRTRRQRHLSLLAVASHVGLGDYPRVDGSIRHPALYRLTSFIKPRGRQFTLLMPADSASVLKAALPVR